MTGGQRDILRLARVLGIKMRSRAEDYYRRGLEAQQCAAQVAELRLGDRLLVQLSGRNNRNASTTRTSPRDSVSDTRVWQFAVLPSAEAYCGATPTECVPFLGIAVSSITSTASLPPTSLSAWTSSSVSTGVASQTPAAIVPYVRAVPLIRNVSSACNWWGDDDGKG